MKNINVQQLRSQAESIVNAEAADRGHALNESDHLARIDEVLVELTIERVCAHLMQINHLVASAYTKMHFGVHEQ